MRKCKDVRMAVLKDVEHNTKYWKYTDSVEFAVNSVVRNLGLSGKSYIFMPNHPSWT